MRFFTQWVTLINYYVYSFYQKWEPDPVGYSVQVTGLLFTLNLMQLSVLVTGFEPELLQPYIYLVLPVLLGVVVANYFVVYARNKHHESFFRVSHQSPRALHLDFYKFAFYFALTVGPFVYLFVRKMITG